MESELFWRNQKCLPLGPPLLSTPMCSMYTVLNQVTIRVDGDEYPKMLANNISLINLETIFIAGNENTRALTNSHMRNNFHGTLDKVSAF